MAQKSQEWVIKVAGHGIHLSTHQDNDEDLWHDLIQALRTSFTETHSAETAFRCIKQLKQQLGKIEEYIVQFDHLLLQSNWQPTDMGTIEAFKGGLLPGLLIAISKRRPKPYTLQEWYEAA